MHVSANTGQALFPIGDPGKFAGCKPSQPTLRSLDNEEYYPSLPPDSSHRSYSAASGRFALLLTYACIMAGIALIGFNVGRYVAARNVEAVAEAQRAVKPVLLKGTVISNYDGDTVTVAINVRLAEIDAPELAQAYGKQARVELARLLPPKSAVTIRMDTIDRYGRMVGYFRVPKGESPTTDVNQQMVLRGAAWKYDAYSKDPAYHQSEETAVHFGLGLWASNQPAAIPPWDYRRKPAKREVLPLPENPFRPVSPLVPFREPKAQP